MLKINFLILFVFILKQFASAQSNPSDNNNIGLCNIYSDTLNLKDLTNCKTITIRSKKKTTVTSFTFAYFASDRMNVKVVNCFSNSISKEDLELFLKTNPKKLFIQDVVGERAKENVVIGHRTFYLK